MQELLGIFGGELHNKQKDTLAIHPLQFATRVMLLTHMTAVTGKFIQIVGIAVLVQEKRKPKRVEGPKNPKEEEENVPQKA